MRRHIFGCFSLIVSFAIIFIGCDLSGKDEDENSKRPPNYHGTYNMIEVPVPEGGITFPVSYDDDNTATIVKPFYLGQTQVSYGFYQMVAYWAAYQKSGAKYKNLYSDYYPYLDNEVHKESDNFFPISEITYFEVIVWCNAYTEWHNEKYGTNFASVYNEESGQPIRDAKKPYSPTYMQRGAAAACFASYYQYIEDHPKAQDYLDNVEITGDGFRLPTPEEWELAARWRGSENTNTVTKTINGIDFSVQPVKFTKGNSASGANAYVGNLNETNRYAVFEYNSNGRLSTPKTKLPNTLGFYDMSGNLREFVYNIKHIDIPSQYDVWGSLVAKAPYPFAQTKGGYYLDTYETIAIGSDGIYVDATAYNYYYGLRVARSK